MQKSSTTLECFAAAEQCDKQALRRAALTNALIDGACVAALVPLTCPVWEVVGGRCREQDSKYRRCTLRPIDICDILVSGKNALFTETVEMCRVLQRVPRTSVLLSDLH